MVYTQGTVQGGIYQGGYTRVGIPLPYHGGYPSFSKGPERIKVTKRVKPKSPERLNVTKKEHY